MRRINILLLVFYLVLMSMMPRLDFTQLSRVFELKEHYQLTEAHSSQKTFVEFLIEHYLLLDHEDTSHEHLPFHQLSLQTPVFLFSRMIYHFSWSYPVLKRIASFYRCQYAFNFSSLIFQPPRMI